MHFAARLLALLLIASANPANSFQDDFESYPLGGIPGIWNPAAQANVDPQRNIITTDPTDGTNQVLQLFGSTTGTNAALASRYYDFPESWILSFDVYNGDEALFGHQFRAIVYLRTAAGCCPTSRRLISFTEAGDITVDHGVTGFATYATNRWYHVEISYEREGTNLTLEYRIDGQLVETRTEIVSESAEVALDYLNLTGHGGQVLYDNVSVTPRDAPAICANDLSNVVHSATYDGHTYHLLGHSTSWVASQADAEALGGNLVTINDDPENSFVFDTFSQVVNDLGGNAIYLGFNDLNQEGDWVWASGETPTYTRWASGQPVTYSGNTEDAAVMQTRDFHLSSWIDPYEWHDVYEPTPVGGNDVNFALVEVPRLCPTSSTPLSRYALDELSGPVIDAQGLHDGVNFGATRGVGGVRGNAFEFDGQNDYVTMSSFSKPAGREFTFSVWAEGRLTFFSAKTPEYESYFNYVPSIDRLIYHGGLYRGDVSISYDTSPLGDLSTSFHHFAVQGVSDGATEHRIRLFVDGLFVDEMNIPFAIPAWSNLELGINTVERNGHYEGRLDEINIWDRALSDQEVWEVFCEISTTCSDSDGDGVPDDQDICLGDDASGDTDADGVCDDSDTCPTDPLNADEDGDGVCDVDDLCVGDNSTGDSDGDQICDDQDLCIGNDATGDTDGDLYCDDTDNCPIDSNPDQADADGDLIGDVCEADTDQDGTIDDLDNCPLDMNPDQADSDGDGLGDICDPDDDGDGIDDVIDNCPFSPNPNQEDFDSDGQGDACDGDDDDDGVTDEVDLCPNTSPNVPIDADGCSGQQLVDLVGGPCDYPNHGQYMSAVVAAANAARDVGLLTNKERAAIVRAAAKNKCE